MGRRLLPLLAAVLVLAGCGGREAQAPPEVQRKLAELVAGGSPGASLFVRHGDRSYTAAAGFADAARRAPMRPDLTLRIGSITKTYVAALVLRLVNERRIELDAPVDRYLPAVLPAGSGVTVRQLLSHRSGLPDYLGDAGFDGDRLLPHPPDRTPRRLIALALRHQPEFPPGSNFAYSNTNYLVLGLLIEKVSGAPLGRELRERLFRPLGLDRTSFPSGVGPAEAHGYFSQGGETLDVTRYPASLAWSAGAITATAEDVADFLRGLFTGRIVPFRYVDEMRNGSPESGGAYGFGLFGQPTRCGKAFGHNGNYPGYTALALSSPSGTRQVVLLLNGDPTLLPPDAQERIADLVSSVFCGQR